MTLRPKYPKREPFFAVRFCRLLAKRTVANEIGPDACWLLSVIVMTEDARRYAGPVTYFNGQLLPVCGFGSENKLIRSREKLIDSGWLHYEPGGKGYPGKYWVQVPAGMKCDDSPIDEGVPMQLSLQNGGANGGHAEGEVKDKRGASGCPSTLTLFPGPTPNTPPSPSEGEPASPGESSNDSGGCESPKKTRQTLSKAKTAPSPERFEEWWALYPRKEKKPKAQIAFAKAVRNLSATHGTEEAAVDFLIEQTRLFAKSTRGQSGQYCPHPATWLNDESFNDDHKEWNRSGSAGGWTVDHRPGPGQIYEPDPEHTHKISSDWSHAGG